MIQLIKPITPTPTFQLGDRVQFQVITRQDNYAPEYGWAYGVIYKVNKVTMNVTRTDGGLYKVGVNELQKYVDPFEGMAY